MLFMSDELMDAARGALIRLLEEGSEESRKWAIEVVAAHGSEPAVPAVPEKLSRGDIVSFPRSAFKSSWWLNRYKFPEIIKATICTGNLTRCPSVGKHSEPCNGSSLFVEIFLGKVKLGVSLPAMENVRRVSVCSAKIQRSEGPLGVYRRKDAGA